MYRKLNLIGFGYHGHVKKNLNIHILRFSQSEIEKLLELSGHSLLNIYNKIPHPPHCCSCQRNGGRRVEITNKKKHTVGKGVLNHLHCSLTRESASAQQEILQVKFFFHGGEKKNTTRRLERVQRHRCDCDNEAAFIRRCSAREGLYCSAGPCCKQR